MKQAFSIFFGLLFTLISIQKTLVFAFYEIEKDYVIEKLCVNKNVKDSCCLGKCFIEKQTSEKEAEGIIINVLKNIKEQFYFEDSEVLVAFQPESINLYEKIESYKLSEYHKVCFHPPNA